MVVLCGQLACIRSTIFLFYKSIKDKDWQRARHLRYFKRCQWKKKIIILIGVNAQFLTVAHFNIYRTLFRTVKYYQRFGQGLKLRSLRWYLLSSPTPCWAFSRLRHSLLYVILNIVDLNKLNVYDCSWMQYSGELNLFWSSNDVDSLAFVHFTSSVCALALDISYVVSRECLPIRHLTQVTLLFIIFCFSFFLGFDQTFYVCLLYIYVYYMHVMGHYIRIMMV